MHILSHQNVISSWRFTAWSVHFLQQCVRMLSSELITYHSWFTSSQAGGHTIAVATWACHFGTTADIQRPNIINHDIAQAYIIGVNKLRTLDVTVSIELKLPFAFDRLHYSRQATRGIYPHTWLWLPRGSHKRHRESKFGRYWKEFFLTKSFEHKREVFSGLYHENT